VVFPPHEPSVETFVVDVEVGSTLADVGEDGPIVEEAVRLEADAEDTEQVPKES
jgi:hypothetical protein